MHVVFSWPGCAARSGRASSLPDPLTEFASHDVWPYFQPTMSRPCHALGDCAATLHRTIANRFAAPVVFCDVLPCILHTHLFWLSQAFVSARDPSVPARCSHLLFGVEVMLANSTLSCRLEVRLLFPVFHVA